MIFSETRVHGVYVVDIEKRQDQRGFFARVWCQKEFETQGLETRIAQVNVAFTKRKGSLRGLHFQGHPHQEAKLVQCTKGAVYDVAVDLRPDSASYRQWVGIELTAGNHRLLYIPEGCAHGYQTLEDDVEISYQTSQFYAPEHARGVRYDDPALGIQWPLEAGNISDADRSWPDYPW
jgi:dTDP-4-dehydrorhamnose 3,5-epimerase